MLSGIIILHYQIISDNIILHYEIISGNIILHYEIIPACFTSKCLPKPLQLGCKFFVISDGKLPPLVPTLRQTCSPAPILPVINTLVAGLGSNIGN